MNLDFQTSTKSIQPHVLLQSFMAFLTACLLLTSCATDTSSEYMISVDQPSESEILSHLQAHGYEIDQLNIEGDFILYEDVVIAIESVIEDMTNPTPEVIDEDLPAGVQSRHRGVAITHALTNQNTKTGLNVYIAPSILQDCGPNTLQSIHDAIDEIVAIQNTTINMQVVDDIRYANITIASDLDHTIFPESSPFYDVYPYSMLANVAFMGIAGPYISIDPNWEKINISTIKSAIMHELGHTLGFHHTGTESGEHIHQTPEDNEVSIMNPRAINTGVFSATDKKAFRMFYAEELSKPTHLRASVHENAVNIKYTNPNYGWKPYYWVRAYRYHADGTLDTFKDFPAKVVRGKGTLNWKNQPEGDFQYRIKGMRYKKDIKSKISVKVAI